MRKSARFVSLMIGTALVSVGASLAASSDSQSASFLDRALNAARAARNDGDLNTAASRLAYLVSVAPDDARVLGEYAKVLTEMGRPDDALDYYKKALARDSKDWRLYNAEGVAFDEKGDFANAQVAYAQALKISADEPAILNNDARSHMMHGDLAGAEKLLAQARATAQRETYFASTQEQLSKLELASGSNAPVAALAPKSDQASNTSSEQLASAAPELQAVPSNPASVQSLPAPQSAVSAPPAVASAAPSVATAVAEEKQSPATPVAAKPLADATAPTPATAGVLPAKVEPIEPKPVASPQATSLSAAALQPAKAAEVAAEKPAAPSVIDASHAAPSFAPAVTKPEAVAAATPSMAVSAAPPKIEAEQTIVAPVEPAVAAKPTVVAAVAPSVVEPVVPVVTTQVARSETTVASKPVAPAKPTVPESPMTVASVERTSVPLAAPANVTKPSAVQPAEPRPTLASADRAPGAKPATDTAAPPNTYVASATATFVESPVAAQETPTLPSAATPAAQGPFSISLGAFSVEANAQTLAATLKPFNSRVAQTWSEGYAVYHVELGSYAAPSEAASTLASTHASGYADARVIGPAGAAVAVDEKVFIRVGTFRSRVHARHVAARLKRHDVHVSRVMHHGRHYFRVWIAELAGRPNAEHALASVQSLGYHHARIIVRAEPAAAAHYASTLPVKASRVAVALRIAE